jgi:hypothetical protein
VEAPKVEAEAETLKDLALPHHCIKLNGFKVKSLKRIQRIVL